MEKSEYPNHGREVILARLREEVIGPQIAGKPLDIKNAIFQSFEEMQGPWMDGQTGEEILTLKPKNRYGAGVLYPVSLDPSSEANDGDYEDDQDLDIEITSDASELSSDAEIRASEDEFAPLDEDTSESTTVRKPSSMGFSFFIEANNDTILTLDLLGGIYNPFSIQNSARRVNQSETWYVRSRFHKTVQILGTEFINIHKPSRVKIVNGDQSSSNLNIDISCFVRPWGNNMFLMTVTAVNRTVDSSHSSCLFQTEFKLNIAGGGFEPYPDKPISTVMIESELYREKATLDDLSSEMLFSSYPAYAIGHNCSVNWNMTKGRVLELKADCFPVFESPSITPDITFENGSRVSIDMRLLSDVTSKSRSISELSQIIDEYENWIHKQEAIFSNQPNNEQYLKAFQSNLVDCLNAVRKMRKGINLLENDSQVFEAFCIANGAMIIQQTRSRLPLRTTTINSTGRAEVAGPHPHGNPGSTTGYWRAFQIAYFLSVIESVANPLSDEREVVDLIFFPTGGGKTEAYLGVIAFTIALRRLRNQEDNGTAVLMRYTLRLLTTQQFLRAASLICALESMRREKPDLLGNTEISIGAWLGGSVTPNRRQDAIKALTSMKNDLKKRPWKKENPFLVLQCPWCAATLGPVDSENNAAKKQIPAIPGYEQVLTMPRTVRIKCPDIECAFAKSLPLYVIDEDIYSNSPSLVIGTVDKFALMSWKPDARSLFGISDTGERKVSPPNLIIQDEFHLISGPLGSMVGHFETVVEELCSSEIENQKVKPKIISSTATIRRFWAQANAVYGRSEVALFPPPLRDISDSFFAVWARENGQLLPGRKYVGVFMPGIGSIRSSEVRVGALLASSAMQLPEHLRDPWWTNLWFFNSLKDLGNAISLFQNDIPKYMKGLTRRDGIEFRRLGRIEELTSRRKNSEIPKVLQQLSATYPPAKGERVWDTCLASNIIEVGIDIDRLSLMTVVSQPKSTAQYIQVTGRVGRRWQERPGLVVTLYSQGRPRDLSHFEHFRTYHERLYAQVEPTSVTPFASPVVLRALRGAMVALLRMTIPISAKPKDISQSQLDYVSDIFENRIKSITGIALDEQIFLTKELAEASDEMRKWRRDEWDGENGMLVRQESDLDPQPLTWAIPNSMRNVDATVATDITTLYHENLQEVEIEAFDD
jgi:hypothetical protein